MKIDTLCLGALGTNCYVIWNEDTKECIIIDPADNPISLQTRCNSLQVTPVAILLTHGHFDHMLAADSLRKYYKIPIYVYEKEVPLMEDSQYNLSAVWAEPYSLKADQTLEDREVLKLAGYEIQVLHTPGHTVGSCCYYIEKENTLISGDTLFYHSIGRTDFPTSRTRSLIQSIKETLFVLPDDTVVYPGHGESTTIEEEKVYNPVAPYCR